jgi:hypothetical protein
MSETEWVILLSLAGGIGIPMTFLIWAIWHMGR